MSCFLPQTPPAPELRREETGFISVGERRVKAALSIIKGKKWLRISMN